MKSPSLLAFAAIVLAALISFPTVHAEEDPFQPVEAEMTNRAVVMKLPEGVRRVRLRVKDKYGVWKTATIAHLEGSEGFLKLRLPDGVAEENCEVAISHSDPFPYSAYQGTTSYSPTDSDNNQQRAGGPAFVAADANSQEADVTVEESDIWKWRDRTLYFFNQFKGLQAIEVSDPAAPTRLATHRVDGWGEQMYLHPEKNIVVLLTYASGSGASVELVSHESPKVLTLQHRIPIDGYITESRLVGNILYVVSHTSWIEHTPQPDGDIQAVSRAGLEVTKINLDDPDQPIVGPPLKLNDGRHSYGGAQVQGTADALLVATRTYDSALNQSISTVHVVDISDPTKTPEVSHQFRIAGQVLSKFNMRLKEDVLTVVSQVWRSFSNTRERFASVETFDLSTGSRGRSISFASNEQITATRFVGDLVYVVTFLRVDPLFVVDLSSPLAPYMVSELEIPGFSTYLQPLGQDTLISIGVEGNKVAVSWFDVSDPTKTALSSRVFIGEEEGRSWTEANWDEKALGFYPEDNLLLVPYSGSDQDGWTTGVQLVELGEKELSKRGSFEHQFQARRAKVLDDVVVSISGRSLRSLDVSDRDNPQPLGELLLAWPVDEVHRVGEYLIQLERSSQSWWWWGSREGSSFLHVSPVSDPDELLTTLELPGGGVRGSFLHNDCLYVGQTENVTVKDETRLRFTTTVIDLGDPDRPIITGRASQDTTAEAERFWGWGWGAASDYVGTLLPDGTLLWHPSELNSFWGFGGFDLAIDFWWAPPGPSVAYTFYISDKSNPNSLAAIQLDTGSDYWSEGTIVLVDSTLYHGVYKSEFIEEPNGKSRWTARHLLEHIDFSDPTKPVVGEQVELPGTFDHAILTPAGGHLLFTTNTHRYQDPENTWHYDLMVQALAFDGMDAFLIGENTIPDWGWGPKTFHKSTLILGTTDYSQEEARTELALYEWDFNGRFQDVQTWDLPDRSYQIEVIDDLLVSLGNDLTLVDLSDLSVEAPATVTFNSTNYYSRRPELIEIHERSVAYLPLNIYGLEVFDFTGAFDPNPDPGPQRSEDPGIGWEKVPLAWLPLTEADNSLMMAALPPLADWALCTPERGFCTTYEEWARDAFRLEPGDPIPAFEGDQDRDGRANGWEYFTGTDPTRAHRSNDFIIEVVTGQDGKHYLTGSVIVNPAAPVGSNMIPQLSFDLETWLDDPQLFEVAGGAHALLPSLAWRSSQPIDEAAAAFLRISVTPVIHDE